MSSEVLLGFSKNAFPENSQVILKIGLFSEIMRFLGPAKLNAYLYNADSLNAIP